MLEWLKRWYHLRGIKAEAPPSGEGLVGTKPTIMVEDDKESDFLWGASAVGMPYRTSARIPKCSVDGGTYRLGSGYYPSRQRGETYYSGGHRSDDSSMLPWVVAGAVIANSLGDSSSCEESRSSSDSYSSSESYSSSDSGSSCDSGSSSGSE